MENNQPFVIDDNPTIDWPVYVKLPDPDGGDNTFRFWATFRVLSPADYEALHARYPVPDVKAPMSEHLSRNATIFAELITNWDSNVRNGSGLPVTFTISELTKQVMGPYGVHLSAGLWTALGEIRWGKPESDKSPGAVEGNSAPPSATGSTAAH